jgi:pantoate--beta-alanine ligase
MQICTTNQAVQALTVHWKSQGKTIAFVPTMGGLHLGHLSLVKKAGLVADKIVVSIFVNPTQFGQNEDFEQYPNTLNQDLELLKNHQVDGVFTPNQTQIYPAGFNSLIKPSSLAQGLCGKSRPEHFDGVVQVVHRLFEIISPDFAIFGQKDYQQFLLIRQMVADLSLPIEVLSGVIVREKNGLAMSTRNQYLSVKQRQIASNLVQILSQLKQDFLDKKPIENLKINAEKSLEKHFKIDYLSILDANTLKSITDNTQQIAILCAVFLGEIRLIDNLIFDKKS